ncbi:MAG: type III pantothenate kinase [Pseudomonadota bacterium]
MLLAIDVGNTNTVFALHDGAQWRAQWRASTASDRTADEYAVWLAQLMALDGLDRSNIKAGIVSSVVPQSLFNVRNLFRRHFHVEPVIVSDASAIGVPLRIDKPSEVGADRLVNAVGAFVQYGGPLIVVDSGTATNFDIVGADGGFEGGIIAPGVNLSMQALHMAAARLPRVAIERPPQVIGKDTVTAMQAGVFWGYVDLIEGLIERVVSEYGAPMKVVATGGVASLFEGALKRVDYFDRDLTVRGLFELYQRHKAAAD